MPNAIIWVLKQETFTGWTGGIGYNTNSYKPLTVTSSSITTLGINFIETSCSFHT